MLTSIIINPIVLDDSPSHIVLNLANCESIEALITISGSFTLLPQPPPPPHPLLRPSQSSLNRLPHAQYEHIIIIKL